MANHEHGGGEMMRRALCLAGICSAALVPAAAIAADAEEICFGMSIEGSEKALHLSQFGQDKLTTISNGYLFIDLRYVSAPYKVQRVGSGIAVNGMLVSCPLRGNLPSVARIAAAEKNWQDPLHGYKPDSYKKAAQANAIILRTALQYDSAVFLSGSKNKVMQLPIKGRFKKESFQRLLRILLRKETPEERLVTLRKLIKEGKLVYYAGEVFKTAEDLKQFEQRSMQSTNFMARATALLAEGEETDSPRPRAVPKK